MSTTLEVWLLLHALQTNLFDSGISEPKKGRTIQVPLRFREGSSNHDHVNVLESYRCQYIEVHDYVASAITDRFQQKGYDVFTKIEKLVIDAANGSEPATESLDVVKTYDEIDVDGLLAELTLLPSLLKTSQKPYNLRTILSVFQSMSEATRSMYSALTRLLKLLLLLPATNATSERNFSHLRRIKSYLRSSMSQQRLNQMLLIYSYRDCYELSSEDVVNEFIENKHDRHLRLAKF